jgi:hypothetical protein
MPFFKVTLEDGRSFKVEADQMPTESDVLSALGEGSGAATDQGRLSTFASGVARGALSPVPGIIGGVGALTGIDALTETAESIEQGINETFPMNPAFQEEFWTGKASQAIGQGVSMLAMGGVGGAVGKSLAAGRGLSQAGQAAAATQAATRAMLGTGFTMGAREGQQEGEKYGLTGLNLYSRIWAGALIEPATEKLPFGMLAETAAMRRIFGDAINARPVSAAGIILSETGEEGLASVGGDIATNIGTTIEGTEGIGLGEMASRAGENAALGAVGGAPIAGLNMLAKPQEPMTFGGTHSRQPDDTVFEWNKMEVRIPKGSPLTPDDVKAMGPVDFAEASSKAEIKIPRPASVVSAELTALAASGQPVPVDPQAIRPQDAGAVTAAAQTNPETLAAVVAMTTNTTPVAAPQNATELQQRWQALEDRALAATEAGATDRLLAIRDEQQRIANQIKRSGQQPPVQQPAPAPATPPEIVAGVEELTDAEALAIDAELGINPDLGTGEFSERDAMRIIGQEPITPPTAAEQPQTQQANEVQEGLLAPTVAPSPEGAAISPQPTQPPQSNVQNQIQETGGTSAIQGVPTVSQPEGQTQAGTAQRSGQGQEVGTLLPQPTLGSVGEVAAAQKNLMKPYAAISVPDLEALSEQNWSKRRDYLAGKQAINKQERENLLKTPKNQWEDYHYNENARINEVASSLRAAIQDMQLARADLEKSYTEAKGAKDGDGISGAEGKVGASATVSGTTGGELGKQSKVADVPFLDSPPDVVLGEWNKRVNPPNYLSEVGVISIKDTGTQEPQFSTTKTVAGTRQKTGTFRDYIIRKQGWLASRYLKAGKFPSKIYAEAVDSNKITFPEGYVKQGDLYVFQPGATGATPVQAAPSAAQAATATAPGPISPALQNAEQRATAAAQETGNSPEVELQAIIETPQYTQEWLQEQVEQARLEGVQAGDTVVAQDEAGETIVGTVAATSDETTTVSTTSGDVTVPTAGLVRQAPQSLSRKPGLAQALMESDGAALQLGISQQDVERGIAATRRQIPSASNIWSGTRQAFLDTFGNDPAVQDMVQQLEEGVMTEGFYVPSLQRGFLFTDSVVVYQGDADRAALNGTTPAVEAAKRLIRHEVGGHGGWMTLTQKQQQQFMDIARDVIPISDMNQMIADGYPFADWQTDEEIYRQAAEEWFSQRLGRLDKLPETGPMARFVDWLKGVWRWLTGRKGDPDLDAIKNLWRQIRMNQAAIATGRAWYSLPREGARAQAVTAQDAEYLAAASKGDSGSDNLIQLLRDAPESERRAVVDAWVQRNPKAAAEMQRMVDEAAKAAGYNVGPLFHGTKADFTTFDSSKHEGLADAFYHFGNESAAMARTKGKGKMLRVFLQARSPIRLDDPGYWMGENLSESLEKAGIFIKSEDASEDIAAKAIRDAGYDSIIYRNDTEGGESYAVFDPNQIKSADPVTRDDQGNIIPPSQRFQQTSPDIRYSRVRSNAELLQNTKAVSFIPMEPETASEQIDVRDSIYAAFRGDPDIERITKETMTYLPMKAKHVAEAALSMWNELTADVRDPSVKSEMTPEEAVANAKTPEEVALAEADHRDAITQAINFSQPVSAEAVARYGITVPDDYALMGALYARFLPNIERAMELVLSPGDAAKGGFAHSTPQGLAMIAQAMLAGNHYAMRANPYERNRLKNYQIRLEKLKRGNSTESGRLLAFTKIFNRAVEATGANVVGALQNLLAQKQEAKIDSVMNVDDTANEVEKISNDSNPLVASELTDEIAALWDRMMQTDDIREAEAIADVLKSLMPRRQNAKRQIASLFPQAGIRDRMNQRGTQLVRNFFQMLAGPRDQSGPLAQFDDSIQSALSEMLRKVVKDAGLLSQNESNQPDAVDKIVRSLSSDPLRFDKIEAADALMQQELDAIEDVERREVLRQAWEEATASMMTNIANPSWTRRAVNDALAGAKVAKKDWKAAFDTGTPRARAVAAIRQKAIDDTIRAIESRLTDPGDTTVQRNLAMVRQEVGEAFDQIAEVKYASWLRDRARAAEQKRLAAMRASIVAALRKQKMSQDTIDRIEKAMAATKGGFLQWSQGTATQTKHDPKVTNPLRDLIDSHSRLEVPDFIEQAVATGLATDDATRLRDAITRYRNSRYLAPDSPLLSVLFNQIKNRVTGDIGWADLISVDQMDGQRRQEEIFKRIRNHDALKGLDVKQQVALTNALNRLWLKKKQEVMKRELQKLGLSKGSRDPRVAEMFEKVADRSMDLVEFRAKAKAVVPVAKWRSFNKQIADTWRKIRSGEMTPDQLDELIGKPRKIMEVDVRNIIDSTSEILRYMNLGMWSAEALRDSISEKYGVKSLNSKEAKEIEDLARQAYNAEPGLPRDKLLVEIMRKMADFEDVSLIQLFQSYRIANLLFSARTFMAAGLTILNSARKLLGIATYQTLAAQVGGSPERAEASWVATKKFFQAMPEAATNALAFLSTGDFSLLPSITRDLEDSFKSGRFGYSAVQMAQNEKIIKGLKQLPRRIKDAVRQGEVTTAIRDVMMSSFVLPIVAVQRIMGAIDLFVGTVSRESVTPLVAALNPDIFDLKKVLAEQRPEAYRKAYDQAQQELFGRPAKGIKERAEASTRAREYIARIFDPYLLEEADAFAAETTYQVNPTGVGGLMYSIVQSGVQKLSAMTKQMKTDLENKLAREEMSAVERQARKLSVAAMRFIAEGAPTDLGVRFIRFTGNRVNELISLTPVLGLLRLKEASIQQSQIKKATLAADQAFASAFALFAMAFIMEEWDDDEKTDEERGWYIEGPWNGLTPAEKDAAFASGKKPYTFAVRVGGRWLQFNYREWQTAGLFTTLGAMMDRKRYQREAWEEQGIAGAAISGVALGLLSFKDMSSMSQMMTLAGNNPYERDPVQGSQDAFGKFAGGYASSMFPTFVRDVDYMMNPEHRKAEFWHEQAVMRIPFGRLYAGQPDYDFFMEPVLIDRGPLSRVVSERTQDPARIALGKLNTADINATAPNLESRIVGRGMDARPMTTSEKVRFQQRWNRDIKRYLVTNTDRLLRMKRDDAQEKIRDDINDIKQEIEDAVAP